MRWTLIRATAMAIVLALPITRAANAAELGGITMPNTKTVSGTQLVLNGIGMRTYSILGIHIYVAALYLKHPDHNARAILASPSLKELQIHFVHAVSVAKVRRVWKKGLRENCSAPCKLSASEVHRFLGAMRPVHAGETFSFVFDRYGANVYEGGQMLGHIDNEQFGRLMLAVFIGRQSSASERKLKRDLLGNE